MRFRRSISALGLGILAAAALLAAGSVRAAQVAERPAAIASGSMNTLVASATNAPEGESWALLAAGMAAVAFLVLRRKAE